MERISIHDYKRKKYKKYYSASKRVYQSSHVERLLIMWQDLYYLRELKTRTRLVPCNKEFLYKKAIPSYNSQLKILQAKYPDIQEFHNRKPIKVKPKFRHFKPIKVEI